MFQPKVQIGELVVKILPSVSTEFENVDSRVPVLLNVTTAISIDNLKEKLQSIVHIPAYRMLLLFCGARLVNKIPLEAFESLAKMSSKDEIKNEDDVIFKPRVYLALLPRDDASEHPDASSFTSDHLHDSDGLRSRQDLDDMLSRMSSAKEPLDEDEEETKHGKKKHFNLKSELESIDCVQHYEVLVRGGYTNKGALARLTETELMGPGLWIPRRASHHILKLAEGYKEAIAAEDHEKEKSAITHLQNELLETGQAKSVAIEAADGSKVIFNTKADIRRAWEEAQHQKAVAERNARLKPKEEVVLVEDPSKKIHSESLQKRIDDLRRKCAQVDEDEGSEDYYSVHSLSKRPVTPLKHDPITIRTDRHLYCCDKHSEAVRKEREAFIAQRKVQHLIEFEVLLNQLESHRNGFVRSSTLMLIARERLAKYKYVVEETDLHALIYDRCAMDLKDLQTSLSWIARDEMKREHLATLIPVMRFSGKKFVVEFSDMLERLDRQHLQDT